MATYHSLSKLINQDYEEQWYAWHQTREEELSSPYGWLALRNIDWLSDGQETKIDGFPGIWQQEGNTITYIPEAGKPVTDQGQVIENSKIITVEGVIDANVANFYNQQGIQAELIKRMGSDRQFAVRQRDPNTLTRQNFTGVPHFQPNKKWVLPAHYVPLTNSQNVTTGSVLSDLSHDETAIGYLYFIYNAKEYKLIVFQGEHDNSVEKRKDFKDRQASEETGFIIFRDATTGSETYGGGRTLSIVGLDKLDYIDFNTATNWPCFFTPFCTCPTGPNENILPFKVLAGESNTETKG